MSLARGDIYWVNFPKRDPKGSEIEKTRPCVILSLTAVNAVRRTVVLVPLTSSPDPAPPIAIAVASAGPDSVAVCGQVTGVDKRHLKKKRGASAPGICRRLNRVRGCCWGCRQCEYSRAYAPPAH